MIKEQLYRYINPKYYNELQHLRSIKHIDQVNTIMQGLPLTEPSISPVIKLHLFNYLSQNPHATHDDIALELNKNIARYTRWEQKALEYWFLPTIGTETELPVANRNAERLDYFDELKIDGFDDGDIREINPPPTYSAWTQGRLLQEMVDFGAAMTHKNIFSGKHKIDSNIPISLHINLGAINYATNNSFNLSDFDNETETMSNILTCAFVSPKRAIKRKTRESYSWRYNSSETKKCTKQPNANIYRLELRANEFRDFTTYRELVEAQMLGGLLFSHIDSETGNTASRSSYTTNHRDTFQIEHDFMVARWGLFYPEAQALLAKYGVTSNKINRRKKEFAHLLIQTPIQKNSRDLIAAHTHDVVPTVNMMRERRPRNHFVANGGS